ncbi:MAG: hypothetical protein KBT49_09485, partial [Bacteroidetes bacterium]|nr:hypothetical protein [Candidatus Colenecus caballi]
IISMFAAVAISFISCTSDDVMLGNNNNVCGFGTSAYFNVSVSSSAAVTKGSFQMNVLEDGLDDNLAFGLVGKQVDNIGVFVNNGVRSADISSSENSVEASAYYPYVSDVDCQEDGTCIIGFSEDAFQCGPMVSDRVEINCSQDADFVNVRFHSIAQRIGFRLCDITEDNQLSDLIEISGIQLYGVATQGIYVNSDSPYWIPQFSRKPYTVFDGSNTISKSDDMISDRLYVVPGSIAEGYVEVSFNVRGFDYDGYAYASSQKSIRISLSDIQPDDDNIYTLALDLEDFFKTIEFSAEVEDWTKESVETNI